jgi:hypothetical protein
MGTIKGSTIRIILAALSFLIYVCTVLALPQQRDNTFRIERTGVAAAVSNIVYGARSACFIRARWNDLVLPSTGRYSQSSTNGRRTESKEIWWE